MRSEKRVFALGFFDGVHLGHQALLQACRAMAGQIGCTTAAITFERHPRSLFSDQAPALISTVFDRHRLLERYGMDHIRCFPVTEEVMSTHWHTFLDNLVDAGAVGFVCGDDFHFGYRGAGNADLLQRYCEERNLPCKIVSEQTVDQTRVSSSLIRRLIESGDMATATKFLGHPHILTGHVIHGQKLGRRLGVPTANLVIPHGIIVPRLGVYACRVIIAGRSYPAVANVGTRPTVNGSGITVEPWILDFEGDLYDQQVQIEFYRFLRPETKFDDLSALQHQIRLDANETRKFFQTH